MKTKFYLTLIVILAIWAAYFFIRHSFIIVGLAPVLGVIFLVVLGAISILYLQHRFGRK